MIDNKTVNYVAALARLHMDDEKARRLAKDLANIVDYVGQLSALDVSQVKPTSHVLEVENVFREDEVLPSLPQTEALAFAVEQKDGHYKVPKVIE